MIEAFASICHHLFTPTGKAAPLPIFDPTQQFTDEPDTPAGMARRLNAAFVILLAGSKHPQFQEAQTVLDQAAHSDEWTSVARFYLSAQKHIHHEIEEATVNHPDLAERIKNLSWILESAGPKGAESQITEEIWKVFFPEGVGLASSRKDAVRGLREKRTVKITRPNPKPIMDPAKEILFASNILLTLPLEPPPYHHLPIKEDLKQQLHHVSRDSQLFWYDHPIHIGVDPPHNEILYGLQGLADALAFERKRGTTDESVSLTCILSASVTHAGLHELARPYIEEVLSRAALLNLVKVYVFTENDTRKIVSTILIPAADYFLKLPKPQDKLEMFGVDGEYGRHYSFLKAIAAFWNVFIDPEIKATFKIDLDQVFPQQILVEQTGSSAFEHFMTPLWGAHGTNSEGKSIELGMIAGALVNESDIEKSLFTADVRFPDRPLSAEEHIFFSTLPQAISTEAEMMTRYSDSPFDGRTTCIQRVHVTGGTNGIRIDSLSRHRPFTPSFIGRAEDQAYLLSAINSASDSLAYLHKDGLIMRHDKEAFAQEAIAAAEIGRTVGDYVRMLYFSDYTGALPESQKKLKDILDPFTGCFISKIPHTVVVLRFALKAAALFRDNQLPKGLELVKSGAERISKAIEFVRGDNSPLRKKYKLERQGWDLYYDILDAVEQALQKKDSFALELRQKAQTIIQRCKIVQKAEDRRQKTEDG